MSDNIKVAKQNLQNIVLGLSDGKNWSGLAEVSNKNGVTQLKITQPSTDDSGKKEQFRDSGIIETYKLIDSLRERGLISGVLKNGSDLHNALQNLAPEKLISIGQGAAVSINERGNVELSLKISEPVEKIIPKLDSVIHTAKSVSSNVAAVKQASTEYKGVTQGLPNPFSA